MQEVVVGAELQETGLEFFGMDEVNALLQQGQRVVKIEPGEVFVEDMPEGEGEEGEEESYAFLGFQIKITLE